MNDHSKIAVVDSPKSSLFALATLLSFAGPEALEVLCPPYKESKQENDDMSTISAAITKREKRKQRNLNILKEKEKL